MHIRFLQLEQADFFINAAGITGQTAAFADDAVAGNDDGDFIVPYSAADSLRRHTGKIFPLGKMGGDVAIGSCLSVGNLQKD